MKATIVSRDENNGRIINLPQGETISIRRLPDAIRPKTAVEAMAAMEERAPAPHVYKVHPYHIDGETRFLLAPVDWSPIELFGHLVKVATKRTVQVIMGNDFPAGVVSTPEKAARVCGLLKERDAGRMMAGRIHWRPEQFVIDAACDGVQP